MKILESWEDHHNLHYAIVKNSKAEQNNYHYCRPFEAMIFVGDIQLDSFGGSHGSTINASFDTLEEAQDFLLAGIEGYDKNPNVWLDLLDRVGWLK